MLSALLLVIAGGVQARTGGAPALPATQYELNQPLDLAITKNGVLYVSTLQQDKAIKRLDLATGLMSALMPDAPTQGIGSLALDAAGNLIAGLNPECRIVQIDPTDGVTRTVAGIKKDRLGESGCGSEGDQGPALKASFEPNAIAIDSQGNLFILDGVSRGRIRRIDQKSGIITTVMPPSRLRDPEAIALDQNGRLFAAQGRGGPHTLLTVDPSTDLIAPVKVNNFAGNKDFWDRSLQRRRIICDPSGNLYASDDSRVYYIDLQKHTVSIVAGTTLGFSGDGGPATKAQFYMPSGLALDSAGNLYIADTENQANPPRRCENPHHHDCRGKRAAAPYSGNNRTVEIKSRSRDSSPANTLPLGSTQTMANFSEVIGNAAAIAKGMGITFKEMLQPAITEEYPDGPAVLQERFRGAHVLQRDEHGLEKCVACFLCAAACPADCIYIEAAENTDQQRISGGERYAQVYNIDYNRCIFCGYCVEACPTDAITHGHAFELASYNTSTLIYRKEQMLVQLPEGGLRPPQHSPAPAGDSH